MASLKKLLQVHKSSIDLEVDVEFVVLPAMNNFPVQVDIKSVYILPRPSSGVSKKPRKKDILNLLSESQIVNLEDEILESL